jgi:hypothetical protein
MFSEGSANRSFNVAGAPSVDPSHRLHQLTFGRRHIAQGALLCGTQRHNPLVESVHEHTAIVVLHRRQQTRERQCRIRRPVAEEAAVQFAARSVDRDLRPDEPTHAECQQRSVALVLGAVTNEPHVSGEQILVRGKNPLQIWRPCLLFAVEHELDVRTERQAAGFDGIDGREQGDDRALVISG